MIRRKKEPDLSGVREEARERGVSVHTAVKGRINYRVAKDGTADCGQCKQSFEVSYKAMGTCLQCVIIGIVGDRSAIIDRCGTCDWYDRDHSKRG